MKAKAQFPAGRFYDQSGTAERRSGRGRRGLQEASFCCLHCHNHVINDPLFSGVQNRNHCPYCLWSRHLDLYRAGDRLSACKAIMQPVGLTLKKTPKKYGPASGELMLIHRCVECGAISINRLAADDDPEGLLRLVAAASAPDALLYAALIACGIQPLADSHVELVRLRLYGWSACPDQRQESLQLSEMPEQHSQR